MDKTKLCKLLTTWEVFTQIKIIFKKQQNDQYIFNQDILTIFFFIHVIFMLYIQ